ncbi:MAG: DUF1553 domain-containing protein [Acidobacteriota bacterium]
MADTLPQNEPAAVGPRLYHDKILPVLEKKCLMCHQGEGKKGGLDLTSREALLKGGDNGPAVIPGNAKASLLYRSITHEQEPGMPYRMDKLPPEVLSEFAEWINAGASFGEPVTLTVPGGGGSPEGLQLFAEVKPLLEEQCLVCHGGKFKQAGLSLLTRDTLLRGSDNGPVIVERNAAASLLVKKVRHEHEPGMPYKKEKLSDAQIARLAAWVDAGAPFEGELKVPAGATKVISMEDARHWAFNLPKRATPPKVRNQKRVRNAVDAFVLAELEKRGLQPVPETDKKTLLRRVYLDLIGLPPTPEETRAFLDDRSKDAYEKVVDRLLESPQYGERWGRHWMDIWRYTDPVSIFIGGMPRVDYSQFDIWNWRDWIVESLNADQGYDRMVMEMLAGDELAPSDPKVNRATGYLARSWYRFNRNSWLQDIVEYTSAGFLGITMRCARCHDHKYDPVAQEEYYRLRAFFEPYDIRTDRVPGNPELKDYHGVFKDGMPRAYDGEPREATKTAPFLPAVFAATYRFIRGDEKTPDMEHPLSPGVPEILGGIPIQIQPIELPIEASYPALRPFVGADMVKHAQSEVEKAESAVMRSRKTVSEARKLVELKALSAGIVSDGSGSSPNRSDGHAEAQPISFEKEIRPILAKNCLSCHKASENKSGLMLEAVETILEGGNINGPAVIPRKSSESPLVQYLRGEKKPRMPMGLPALAEQDIQKIAAWIDQLPEDEPEVALRKAEAALAVAEKNLAWAKAYLPALKARIAADHAKYSDPPDPKAEELAQEAKRLDRYANLLKAEENLLRAQQKLTHALTAVSPSNEMEDKLREKRVSSAKKELEAAQTALSQSVESYTPIGKVYPKTSTGRRLALARWIASEQNPLTARVAVNHMWGRHFGAPLVATPANFGISGRPPSHPELLDWLALELVANQWRMKPIHHLIVTSGTYRLQSSPQSDNDPAFKKDPENRYLWRMNPQRMEAEAIRDSLLHLTGQLDLTMGGPELDADKDDRILRRSLYFRHSVDEQSQFLRVFNSASPEECYERTESIVPQQALALTNSKLSYRQARVLASQLSERHPGKAAAFIQSAFETILGRPASPGEIRKSTGFLDRQAALFSAQAGTTEPAAKTPDEVLPSINAVQRARESFVHALFSHTDFVTIR